MSNEPEQFIPENLQADPAPARVARPQTNWALIGCVSVLALLLGLWASRAILTAGAPKRFAGQGWDYHQQDIELTAPLSGEMTGYQDHKFYDLLSKLGGQGWELVLSLPLPRQYDYQGARYRLIFKRHGDIDRVYEMGTEPRGAVEHDRERYESALKAESAARQSKFERQLDDIEHGRR